MNTALYFGFLRHSRMTSVAARARVPTLGATISNNRSRSVSSAAHNHRFDVSDV